MLVLSKHSIWLIPYLNQRIQLRRTSGFGEKDQRPGSSVIPRGGAIIHLAPEELHIFHCTQSTLQLFVTKRYPSIYPILLIAKRLDTILVTAMASQQPSKVGLEAAAVITGSFLAGTYNTQSPFYPCQSH